MSDRINDLIKEIEALLGENSSENTEQTNQTVQDASNEEANYDEQDLGDYQQLYNQLQWEQWKNIGRNIFISRYANMPNINISKYIPFIEQRAEQKFQADLVKGTVKDGYDKYLDEAFKEVLEELKTISREYYNMRNVIEYQENLTKQFQQKPYTLKDYRNDYKKLLEYATYKDVAEIYYKDGSERGRYGEPKLKLGERIEEINI